MVQKPLSFLLAAVDCSVLDGPRFRNVTHLPCTVTCPRLTINVPNRSKQAVERSRRNAAGCLEHPSSSEPNRVIEGEQQGEASERRCKLIGYILTQALGHSFTRRDLLNRFKPTIRAARHPNLLSKFFYVLQKLAGSPVLFSASSTMSKARICAACFSASSSGVGTGLSGDLAPKARGAARLAATARAAAGFTLLTDPEARAASMLSLFCAFFLAARANTTRGHENTIDSKWGGVRTSRAEIWIEPACHYFRARSRPPSSQLKPPLYFTLPLSIRFSRDPRERPCRLGSEEKRRATTS